MKNRNFRGKKNSRSAEKFGKKIENVHLEINHKNRKMNTKPYCAFLKFEQKKVVESKMPVPLDECFPTKKVVKITVRQFRASIKRRRRQRKLQQSFKSMSPKYKIRDPSKLRKIKKSKDAHTMM